MIDKSINKNIDRILIKLKSIPETPGVYQHLDEAGRVIYVGKARNLQRRVSSYFMRYDDHTPKIKMLVRNICDFRVTVVATEVDALLLENNLIKQYQPRYNSLLKDGKTYPYLCITHEDYPRVEFTRSRNLDGDYFGPYPNQRILRELQDIIGSLFNYRSCKKHLTRQSVARSLERPCTNFQMGLCKAPCTGEQTYEEYQATIAGVRKILKGDFDDVLSDMKSRMFALADELRFEEAEVLRRKVRLLEEYQSRSAVVNTNVRDVDVFGIISDERYAYVSMLRIKSGAIVYTYTTEIKKQLDESDPQILSTVIPALHEQTRSTAKEVILQARVEDIPEEYLTQTIPSRGDRKQLLDLAMRNVVAYQRQCSHQRMLIDPESSKSHLLQRLQQALQLPQYPMNIECFDNSNIQGAYPVAAMVRFTGGKPNRKEYRTFNIKTVEGPDDYASMAEVIYRRYKRLSEEGKELPQLLIVDGGKGQMKVARQVIEEQLHLDIPIAGLAKNDSHRTNELLFGFPPQVVGMKPTDQLFHLMEQIQNEVHRFAITFHRNKRSKGTIRTSLTDIPGIGQKTAQDLLLKFGSVKEISTKTLADLTAAIGASKAKLVYDFYNK